MTGTLSGFLAPEQVTATYSRTSGESVAGSPYTISATLSPAAALDNYTITCNMASLMITPIPASVTPDAASKVYGTADPALTGTLSGFLATDGVTATYSRTVGESVGGSPYAISAILSPTGAVANYTVTYNTAAFTIIKANAAVTPNAATKAYGTPDPALTGTLSGFLAADHVTATYTRTSGESVAGSPYTISAMLSPAASLLNYTIIYNTAPFTITGATAPPPGLSHGDTATIGFWHNKNGQAVLNCLNGGPNSVILGNYLASTYPSLFGTGTGSLGNLANKKNSEIAAVFLSAT